MLEKAADGGQQVRARLYAVFSRQLRGDERRANLLAVRARERERRLQRQRFSAARLRHGGLCRHP